MSRNDTFVKRCEAVGLYEGSLFTWLEKVEQLTAENEALKQQVEQGNCDAERYRWLSEYLIGMRCDLDDAIVGCVTKAEMDTVIDAAAPKQEK